MFRACQSLIKEATYLLTYFPTNTVRAVVPEKAAVVLRKVAEGLRFECGQYGAFAVLVIY